MSDELQPEQLANRLRKEWRAQHPGPELGADPEIQDIPEYPEVAQEVNLAKMVLDATTEL